MILLNFLLPIRIFQFLNGAIKIRMTDLRGSSFAQFQFLNGAIKISPVQTINEPNKYFNSLMVRLKYGLSGYSEDER